MNLIKKIANCLFRETRNFIIECAYVIFLQKSSKYKEKHISSEDHRFIKLNRKYWQASSAVLKKDIILVEGFFAASGHNYLFRTGMLAKAVEEKLNLKIVVLFDKPSYKVIAEQKKYMSFGIETFLYIKPGLRSIVNYVRATKTAILYYFSLKTVEDLLSLKQDQILLGDLLYDDLLKNGVEKYTIPCLRKFILKRLIQLYFYYYTYLDIFKKFPIKYLISTHLVYVQYGLLARLALKFNINVIETNDLMVNYLHASDYNQHLISPTYHDVIKEKIEKFLLGESDSEKLVSKAEQALNERMTGAVQQFDVRFAYQNKIKLAREEFLEALNIKQDCPRSLIVVFAHVFSDAPHSSARILFRDYYDWLAQTLKVALVNKHVNWIIKPHPASCIYGELGAVEHLIIEAQKESINPNVFLYPEGVSAANIANIVDAIVTVQGTAGIEFSCLSLPVVLAGKAFYSGQGFTYDPISQEEYFSLLANIHTFSRLNSAQVKRAKIIYAAYMHVMNGESQIITESALDAIWGYGNTDKPNIDLGNKIINDHLENHDPKDELQYLRLKEYLG